MLNNKFRNKNVISKFIIKKRISEGIHTGIKKKEVICQKQSNCSKFKKKFPKVSANETKMKYWENNSNMRFKNFEHFYSYVRIKTSKTAALSTLQTVHIPSCQDGSHPFPPVKQGRAGQQ